jgi:hypothetical protein
MGIDSREGFKVYCEGEGNPHNLNSDYTAFAYSSLTRRLTIARVQKESIRDYCMCVLSILSFLCYSKKCAYIIAEMTRCKKMIDEAMALLAKVGGKLSVLIVANNNSLAAIAKLKQAIECLKALLG